MAGHLNTEGLSTYATVGAKIILTDKNTTYEKFENNPDGCFRSIVVEYLFNEYFIQPLVDDHPSFLPVAENLRRTLRDNSVQSYAEMLDKTLDELFNSSMDLYLTETYQYDVNFNIMLAAIFYNFLDQEQRQQYEGKLFFPVIEQCDEVTGFIPVVLLACALWGADYGNYRTLTINKYTELKAQGFGQKDAKPTEESESEHNDLLRQARENIENFDEKFKFIQDISAKIDEDYEILDSKFDIGKKYVKYYMEIEKHYMPLFYRIKFVSFCLFPQPESLFKNGGFVPLDYYTGQIEKTIHELDIKDERIQFLRALAGRARAMYNFESMQALANCDYDTALNSGWEHVCKNIYDKSAEWGWDRYMEDNRLWDYTPRSQNMANQTDVNTPTSPQSVDTNTEPAYTSHTDGKSGGCYIATAVYGSYDCPEVWTLRRFRDFFLAQSCYGRVFIKVYYAISPILVKWFGKTKWFNRLCKGPLNHLVTQLRNKGYEDSPYYDI